MYLQTGWKRLTFMSRGFPEVIFLFGGDLNCMRMPGPEALFDLTGSAISAEKGAVLPAEIN